MYFKRLSAYLLCEVAAEQTSFKFYHKKMCTSNRIELHALKNKHTWLGAYDVQKMLCTRFRYRRNWLFISRFWWLTMSISPCNWCPSCSSPCWTVNGGQWGCPCKSSCLQHKHRLVWVCLQELFCVVYKRTDVQQSLLEVNWMVVCIAEFTWKFKNSTDHFIRRRIILTTERNCYTCYKRLNF